MGEDANISIPNNSRLYPESIKTAISNIHQDFFDMTEKELYTHVKPSLTLYQVKLSFHDETMLAHTEGRVVKICNIIKNIYSEAAFYKTIKDPGRMAWIVAPIIRYEDKTYAALNKAAARYEELISMDITNTKRKKVDGEWIEYKETCPKKALVLLSVIKNLEDRVKGTAIQRQLSVHSGTPKGESKAALDMESVENKLKELEMKLGVSDEKRNVREQVNSDNSLKGTGASRTRSKSDDIRKPADDIIVVEAKQINTKQV